MNKKSHVKALAGALVLALVFSTSVFAKGSWQKNKGKWNLVNQDGTLNMGWQYTGGHWYYLGKDGTMQTGWLHDGASWYLLNNDGAMETGWQKVNSNWYYMYADGSMASNTTVQGYKVDSSGAWQDNSTGTSADSASSDTTTSTTDTSTSPDTTTSTIDLSTGTNTTTDTTSTDNTTTGTTTDNTSGTSEDSSDGDGKITKDQLAATAVEIPADAVVNGVVNPSLVPQDGKFYHYTETIKHGKGQGKGEIATYDCYYQYVSTVGTKGAVIRIAFKVHNNTDDTTNSTQNSGSTDSTQNTTDTTQSTQQ